MNYHTIVEMIPAQKKGKLSQKLIDFILKSKNAGKMPSHLAKTLLQRWQEAPLTNNAGLAAVLEAAATLEPDKTASFLRENMQLLDVVKAMEQ